MSDSQLAEAQQENADPELAAKLRAAQDALDEDVLVRLAKEFSDVNGAHGQEAAIAELIAQRMGETGIDHVHLEPLDPGRANVVGTSRGTGGGKRVMFTAHLETGFSTDPTEVSAPARVEDGVIIADGVINMRGALASYIEAANAVRRAGIDLPGDVVIVGHSGAWDESPLDSRIQGPVHQGYGYGITRALDRGVTADFAVVGEATSFAIIRATYGTQLMRIDIRSQIGQGAAPVHEDVVSVVSNEMAFVSPKTGYYLAELLGNVNEWLKQYRETHLLDGVAPTAGISGIEGGFPYRIGTMQDITVYVWAHTMPGASPADIVDDLREAVEATSGTGTDFAIDVAAHAAHPGPDVPADDPCVVQLREAHRDVFGDEPTIMAIQFYTDASALTVKYGIPSVNYGFAGQHADERYGPAGQTLTVEDLVRVTRVYIDLIVRICSQTREKQV